MQLKKFISKLFSHFIHFPFLGELISLSNSTPDFLFYLFFDRYKDEKCVETLPYTVSRAKAEGLGVEFTPIEVSIKDTIESFKEKNLVSF